MTEKDVHDDAMRTMFDVARRQRPSPALRDRVLGAALPSEPVPERGRHRVFTVLGLAAAVGVAIAIFVFVPPGREPVIALSPEPASKKAESATAPSSKPEELAPAAHVPQAKHAPPRASVGVPADTRRPDGTRDTPPPSLSDEIAVLDRARVALASDPAHALEILDDYDRVLHGTRLVAEATLLRIEAFARAGQSARASTLAQRFVEANPGSAFAERARSFVTTPTAGASSPRVDAGGNRR